MPAGVVYTFTDFDGEKSSCKFALDDVTNEGALRVAVDNVSDGQMAKYTVIANEMPVSNNFAALSTAQREMGLRLYLNDNVSGEGSFITIPCPKYSALTFTQGVVVLADGAAMAALVTEVQTHVRSRAGNAVTVTSAKLVGRNTWSDPEPIDTEYILGGETVYES